ncbi:MAG: TetR/AcrR family transcriptional regulator, partial [Gemmatimonadetes bacterium]|nr:TetR/AcrR family transcriptional regulator [Gemmatimonadota bacterium]
MASAQPSTAKRAQIQEAVLAATEELLGAGGSFQDLKIEKIATSAGISRTAFYFYFKDKRELLMHLAEDITSELYSQADEWFTGNEGEPEDQVSGALSAISSLYFEHGPLLRAIVEVSTYDEEIATFWRALLQRFADATTARIKTE